MSKFISCDWGTSAFRLRLIDAITQNISAEILTQQGITAMYELWKPQQNINRFSFYCNYINTQIQKLEQQTGTLLNEVPLIISGMASAAIGMKELPYKKIPFVLQPENLLIDVVQSTRAFPHKTILVSGICSANDVMRGEESILAGCAINSLTEKQLFILPGTHSKHIIIENGILTGFKTYMTGELFQLLSTKSILAGSIEQNDQSIETSSAFIKGVRNVALSSILNTIFHVRINALFSLMNKKDNYAYLSGLLIGEEVKQLLNEDIETIIIVSSGSLQQLYYAALSALNKNFNLSVMEADKALITAQTVLFNLY